MATKYHLKTGSCLVCSSKPPYRLCDHNFKNHFKSKWLFQRQEVLSCRAQKGTEVQACALAKEY